MVMAANGTLITSAVAGRMKSSGIQRVSISLTERTHPLMIGSGRCKALLKARCGNRRAQKAGIEFQINTTITRHNVDQAQAMLDLAVRRGAAAHHIFCWSHSRRQGHEQSGNQCRAV